MPAAFGAPPTEEERGLAVVSLADQAAMKKFFEMHKTREANRMGMDEELDSITELSDKTQVYIYSVGAWPQPLVLASLGSRWVPCLPEDQVLVANDLTVAGPLIIAGVPSEPYPDGDGGKRIYHRPKKADPLRKHTGLHLALEAIGAGQKSRKDMDLRPYGLFVSLQPEQQKPEGRATPEVRAAFAQWEKDVKTAQRALRGKFSRECAAASEAHRRGHFSRDYMNDERIFVMARILRLTKLEAPWLENLETARETKNCIMECGAILPLGAVKCGQCGAYQMTKEKAEAEMLRRQALVS